MGRLKLLGPVEREGVFSDSMRGKVSSSISLRLMTKNLEVFFSTVSNHSSSSSKSSAASPDPAKP